MPGQPHQPVGESRYALLAPTVIGTLTHALVAELLTAQSASPTRVQIIEGLRRIGGAGVAATYRQSIRQRVVTGAATYFRLFDRRPRWQPLGLEAFASDVRLDVLWISGRAIEADEIKTGPSALYLARPEVLAQARAQVGAGLEIFGGTFRGVRVLLLAAPAASYFVNQSGRVRPLERNV